MAREIYGHGGFDYVAQISSDGDYEPSTATFDVFTTRTGSTQHTSLLNMAGGAITVVVPDAAGWIRFQGQDTYRGSYWLQNQATPSNPRWRMDPVGMAERIIAVEAGGGAGVTDGDKGDVVVSSSGAVWTVDNNAVTLAKMADIATARILGRTTAATGDPEALTAAQVMAMFAAASTTVVGPVELATDAEALALADTTRAVTASNLAAVLAAFTVAIANLPASVPLFVEKAAGVWPARPTSVSTRRVFWIGADPAPAIITSGTAGMYAGDIHIVAP